MVQNKSLMYLAIPETKPVIGKHIEVQTKEFDPETEAPKNGITVKTILFSFDPYMRGRMRDPSIKSYLPAFSTGQPLVGFAISKVIKSNNSGFKPGQVITGVFPCAEYGVVPEQMLSGATVIDNKHNLPLQEYLGALGMPGLTAYSSFYDIGKPKKGETIFISAASGAVGQLVGQLAKHEGLTVIGSVGSDDKLDLITKELKFDHGFNYKKEKPADALKRLAPDGIHIYYENVGGEHLEAALDAIKDFGRIVLCGMVSQYNLAPQERYPIRNLMSSVSKRLTMRGFIVSDENMGPRYWHERNEKVGGWIADGSFKTKTSVTDGMDDSAEGFLGMLEGKNFGKAVLKIADAE